MSSWRSTLLAVAVLVTLTVSQSAYEVLAANRPFLGVRRVTNPQLVAIILVFNVVPVMGLFFLWTLLRRLNQRVGSAFLGLCYFLLFWLFFVQIQRAYVPKLPGWGASYALWGLAAAVLSAASFRFASSFRVFVLSLSPSLVLFPALFLYRSWVPSPNPARPALQPAGAVHGSAQEIPPVFLVVLDELTLHALLDPRGELDGQRFPNFKRLAGESHWFRNTTANADETVRAIPVILTGNFPKGFEASARAYPNNLFSLLASRYHVFVHENWFTQFCDPQGFHCLGEGAGGLTLLFRDISFLLASRLSPPAWQHHLPDMTRTWGHFRDSDEWIRAVLRDTQHVLSSLALLPKEQVFFYSHIALPHSPYALTEDGRVYATRVDYFSDSIDAFTLKNMHRRYLMQARYVDRWLGEFLRRLKELEFYDRSLLVVTADHGVSWKPESPGPWLAKDRAEMILTVPLFIKLPFQTRGVVSIQDVQHVDVLPTIAAFLGLRIPWEVAGRPVFEEPNERRPKVAYNSKDQRVEFADNLGLVPVESRFDSPLLGGNVRQFEVLAQSNIRGHVDSARGAPGEDLGGTEAPPVYVSGWAASLDGAPTAIEVTEGVGRTGRYALTVSGEDGGAYQDVGGLKPGQTYEITTWARAAAEQAGRAMLWVHDTTEANRADDGPRDVGDSQAESFRVRFRATATQTVRIHLHVLDSAVYWDDVSVRPGEIVNGGFETGRPAPWTRYGRVLPQTVSEPLKIVITLNDEIVTIAQPGFSRPDVARQLGRRQARFARSGWLASFSSAQLRKGSNTIAAYVLLHPVERKLVSIGSLAYVP